MGCALGMPDLHHIFQGRLFDLATVHDDYISTVLHTSGKENISALKSIWHHCIEHNQYHQLQVLLSSEGRSG